MHNLYVVKITSQPYETSNYASSVKLISCNPYDFSYFTEYSNLAEFQFFSTTKNGIICITYSKDQDVILKLLTLLHESECHIRFSSRCDVKM